MRADRWARLRQRRTLLQPLVGQSGERPAHDVPARERREEDGTRALAQTLALVRIVAGLVKASDLSIPFASLSLSLLALGAVSFELCMPLLVAWRGTRPVALLGAIIFHALTAKLMFIRFDSLAALLVSLIDLRPSPTHPASRRWRTAWLSTRVLGGAMLLAILAAGFAGATQLYPFACYPTFHQQAPATMPSAQVTVITGEHRCVLARPRGNAEWVQAFRIAGAYGDRHDETRARSYLQARLRTRRADCTLAPDSQIMLTVQQLRWDHRQQRAQVAASKRVYATLASSLGNAPDDGSSASSSPPR
jgi:hypothetical protein